MNNNETKNLKTKEEIDDIETRYLEQLKFDSEYLKPLADRAFRYVKGKQE